MRKSKIFQFHQNIKSFIDDHHLIPTKATLLVGVSGGPDSICLLLSLKQLQYKVIAAHINYKLRGNDSDADELLVRQLCAHHDIPFYSKEYNTPKLLQDSKKGLQELARDLRYSWFYELCVQLDISYIATGHHQDDQAETVLFNLIRGSGALGAQGILKSSILNSLNSNDKKSIQVVRPLLQLKKSELMDYLEDQNIAYAIDASNLTSTYSRNKIRHDVIPLLESIQPRAAQHLYEFAMKMQEWQRWHQAWSEDLRTKYLDDRLDPIQIKLYPDINALALYTLLSPYGFNTDQIDQLHVTLKKNLKGKKFESSEYVLITDGYKIELMLKNKFSTALYPIESLPFDVHYLSHQLRFRKKRLDGQILDVGIYLNMDELTLPLLLRPWEAGDVITPLGMTGKTKKIKNLLTDKKISGISKQMALVLCHKDTILWCWPGDVIHESVKVTSTTQEVLVIEVLKI